MPLLVHHDPAILAPQFGGGNWIILRAKDLCAGKKEEGPQSIDRLLTKRTGGVVVPPEARAGSAIGSIMIVVFLPLEGAPHRRALPEPAGKQRQDGKKTNIRKMAEADGESKRQMQSHHAKHCEGPHGSAPEWEEQ